MEMSACSYYKTVRLLRLLCSAATLHVMSTQISYAQTTPTELVDLSLEVLLDLDIGFEDDPKSKTDKTWEFKYSYTQGSYGGYKMGTSDVSFDDVLYSPGEIRTADNFPVVPTYIDQCVDSFAASYFVTPMTRVNILVPYVSQSSEHISSVTGFDDFTLRSEGIGDIAVSVAHQHIITESSSVNVSVGLLIPTGATDRAGDTPRNGVGTLERLPYSMQLGSGTLDVSGLASYSRRVNHFNLGVSTNAVIRTGYNDNNYRLGNNFSASASTRYVKHAKLQPGLKLTYRNVQSIQGRDESLLVAAPFEFPASITDPSNYGGTSVNTGFTLKLCQDARCKLSIAAEYDLPIYQNLNGVQPKTKHALSLAATWKLD